MGMFSSISNNAMLALNNSQAVAGRPNVGMAQPGYQNFEGVQPIVDPITGMPANLPNIMGNAVGNTMGQQTPPGLPTGSAPGGKGMNTSNPPTNFPIMQQDIISGQPNAGMAMPGVPSIGQFTGGLRPAPRGYRAPMRPGSRG